MFQSPRQLDTQDRDSLTCDMDSPQVSTPPSSQPMPQSASSSDTTSPALSMFSKSHAARSGSNASSIASSPAMRDSFENFTPSKRFLTDVKEEPHEREDADMTDALNSHAGMLHFTSCFFVLAKSIQCTTLDLIQDNRHLIHPRVMHRYPPLIISLKVTLQKSSSVQICQSRSEGPETHLCRLSLIDLARASRLSRGSGRARRVQAPSCRSSLTLIPSVLGQILPRHSSSAPP